MTISEELQNNLSLYGFTTSLYRVEIKNVWSYNSSPQHIFMASCLVKHKI